ncbi:MAG TPA: zinc-binding dehydrogenase [Lacunisphaera sp.]|nr:zinc-binding dehydrogenase [Lacunisphaera sp.]
MNFLMKAVLGLLSGGIILQAGKRGAAYSFLFVHPDGGQLAQIGALLETGRIRPVVDRVFTFDQAKEALDPVQAGGANPRRSPQSQNAQTHPDRSAGPILISILQPDPIWSR